MAWARIAMTAGIAATARLAFLILIAPESAMNNVARDPVTGVRRTA
jgi:hypothetical protein